MGFLKVATFTLAIIFGCYPVSIQGDGDINEACLKKCKDAIDEERKTGDSHCVERMGDGKIHYEPENKCMAECKGVKLAEDKNACLCKYCKMVGLIAAQFCTAPGEPSIKLEECDSMVCTGKAKLFGDTVCDTKHLKQR